MAIKMEIRAMQPTDWNEVSRIYKSGIETKNATFETKAPAWEVWDKGHRADCRFVALVDGKLAGWVALSNVSGRCVYSGVAEVSVYIDDRYKGLGIGTRLMEIMVVESEQKGIWTLQAGIFPENTASVKLHQKMGFRIVGYREKLGKMDNNWRDVLLLERRSSKTGLD